MAVRHPVTIAPTKLELLQAWVPSQPWLAGADATALTVLGSYRFDDPDGEVGIETHLLGTADGQVLHVPLTYRGAPLACAEQALITTMTHGALGDRWVYDGCDDPVYRTALARAVLAGGREAALFTATGSGLVEEAVTTRVRGSGSLPVGEVPDWSTAQVLHAGPTTRMHAGATLVLLRVPTEAAEGPVLTGTWPGQPTPRVLATVDERSADADRAPVASRG